MKAVVSTPGGERWAELRDVPEPEPAAGEALVQVHAAGINRGELALLEMREEFRPGQEVAGVVVRAAEDGPRDGQRVVGLADWHGWAPLATVPAHRLVPLPDGIDFATAAALPMAGATALNLIRLGGDLLGRNVLVTGASGGVGTIAVQLARLAGANVTGVSAVTEDAPDGQHLILESVGGASLERALAKVALGGLILVFGNSSRERASIDFRDYAGRDAVRIRSFFSAYYEDRAADNLRTLLALVGDGRLQVSVGLKTPLADVNDALDALAARQVPGKAILTMEH
jgi:NADPH:quinone reductase